VVHRNVAELWPCLCRWHCSCRRAGALGAEIEGMKRPGNYDIHNLPLNVHI